MVAPWSNGGSMPQVPRLVTASQLTADRYSAPERLLPCTALATVLRRSGLPRGSTVAVHGSVALLLTLLEEATTEGSWAAVVGMPDFGLVAAEMGVAVERLGLVLTPPWGAKLRRHAGCRNVPETVVPCLCRSAPGRKPTSTYGARTVAWPRPGSGRLRYQRTRGRSRSALVARAHPK